MRSYITPAIAAILAVAGVAGAQGQTTLQSTETYQVGVGGIKIVTPKTGSPYISDSYTDVEGTGTGSNASGVPYSSFGVIDFAGTATPAGSTISSLTLNLTDAPASFTAPGTMDVYLVPATTALTASNPTAITYQVADTTFGGIGTQMGSLSLLGKFNYTSTSASPAGTPLSYTFTPMSSSAQSLFLSELNSGDVRLALADDASTPNAAGTFAGFYGPNLKTPLAAPSLSFNASPPVPEASTTASFGLLLVLGLGRIAVARRRKQA